MGKPDPVAKLSQLLAGVSVLGGRGDKRKKAPESMYRKYMGILLKERQGPLQTDLTDRAKLGRSEKGKAGKTAETSYTQNFLHSSME